MKRAEKRPLKKIAKKVYRFWVPALLWAAVIFLFSSFPTSPVTEIHWKDFVVKKSAHVVEYAILTALFYRALKESGVGKRKAGVYSVIFAVLYGVSDEFHQSFTPGRDPKIRDVIFDTIGSVFAIYFLWSLLPKAPKRLKKLARNWHFL